jgi:ribosomal protein S18 acetylase RimI-like enzyme
MGEAGHRKARRSFDERTVVATVLDAYRRVAMDKGLTRLAEALGKEAEDPRVRRAILDDANTIARLHSENIASGFLSRLGRRFLVALYRALIRWPESVVLVADAGAGPIGFVAGVTDTGAFYKHFLTRRTPSAVVGGLPALLRPSNLRRVWETLSYRHAPVPGRAELLSMGVDPGWRGRGLGHRLGNRLLEELATAGAGPVKVVVGGGNLAAISVYDKLGFIDAGAIEVHAGETSRVLLWSGTAEP